MNVISKSEARAQGLRRFFTGRPCKHGHLSERETRTSRCVECRRVHGVAEHRRYYVAHKERLNAISRAYYANLPEDKKRAAQERWRAFRRLYAQSNTDKERARRREYYAANKQKYSAYVHNRNARKRNAPGTHTPADINKIRKLQRDRCALCRLPLNGKGEIDHILSIKSGGSNWPRNLQLLCKPCNRSKNAKDPIEHARSLGFLL